MILVAAQLSSEHMTIVAWISSVSFHRSLPKGPCTFFVQATI